MAKRAVRGLAVASGSRASPAIRAEVSLLLIPTRQVEVRAVMAKD
jgi:hypothetical protein